MLVRKAMLAIRRTGLSTVVLGGGVAANGVLRAALAEECGARNLAFHAAKMAYCTDNAAMIASLGFHLLASGSIADLSLTAHASGSALRS